MHRNQINNRKNQDLGQESINSMNPDQARIERANVNKFYVRIMLRYGIYLSIYECAWYGYIVK